MMIQITLQRNEPRTLKL